MDEKDRLKELLSEARNEIERLQGDILLDPRIRLHKIDWWQKQACSISNEIRIINEIENLTPEDKVELEKIIRQRRLEKLALDKLKFMW